MINDSFIYRMYIIPSEKIKVVERTSQPRIYIYIYQLIGHSKISCRRIA